MSGTSMDGVDAVAAQFEGPYFRALLATWHSTYSPTLRQRLLELVSGQHAADLGELCRLDAEVAEAFAHCANRLIESAGIDRTSIEAIGSHGQTVFHDARDEPRLSLQLGDPNRITARTGLTTVADFRRRDLALGGQGAPLVPAFHHATFARADEARAVLNLGGIANLSLLPGLDPDAARGFDTGPGNALLDEWAQTQLGTPYDADGTFAASGRPDEDLVATLLEDPYFALPPPKSTGRGDFHLAWARRRFQALETLAPADVQASFLEVTVRSVAAALRRALPQAQRVLVCGGGTRNGQLMHRLKETLAPLQVETTAAHGLDPAWVEASAFAWLAAQTLNDLPGNLPAVTGAARAAVLGGIYRA
jgi:anhydro-N-acetylmuramic acid kinase